MSRKNITLAGCQCECKQFGICCEILSQRERQAAGLLARGMTNREIAAVMRKTEHSVKGMLRHAYDKLGLSNRVELALWCEARRHGVDFR